MAEAESKVPKKPNEEDSLSLIRMATMGNLVLTLILLAALYVHMIAPGEANGFYVRPRLSTDDIMQLLKGQGISVTPAQGEGLTDALNDRVGEEIDRTAEGGVVTITVPAGEAGEPGTPGSQGEPGETGTAGAEGEAGGEATVSVSVDGGTIEIFVSPACCGTCNATPPSCTPPPETCQGYDQSCQNDSECCEGYACVDGQCGFPPTPSPAPAPSPIPSPSCRGYDSVCTNSSECCEGYSCVDGQCGFPPPNPTPVCQTSGPCQNNSECCSPYACVSGYCNLPAPEPTCQERGESCGPNKECCEELTCDNTTRTCRPLPSCSTEGEYCVSASDCCQELACTNNECAPVTPAPNPAPSPPPAGQELCSETDSGANYYQRGTTTGSLSGTWGSYTDYCNNPNQVTEYYCQIIYGYDAQGLPKNTPTQNVSVGSVTCQLGCSNGRCN